MQDINEQEKLRKYIFGDLAEGDDLLKIEERLMQDAPYFEELAIVEEELIQDYIEKKLSDDERAKFEQRFLMSEENLRRLKFAQALDRVVNSSDDRSFSERGHVQDSPSKFQFLSPVSLTLGAICILGVLGFLVWQISMAGGQSETLASLNKAFNAGRPIESRITEFDYAAFSATRGSETQTVDKVELELSKTLALKAVRDSETANNLHSLGRVYLAERKFDKAIEQFNKGIRLSPNNARLNSDLGVAWLEKGKLDGRNLKYLGTSLRELEKAIELDKSLSEAYFNRALCLELMDVPDQAKKAWQKYIEIDSSSKWTDEAKQKLKSLRSNKSHVQTSGDLIREFLDVHRKRDYKKAWEMLSRNRESVSGKLIPEQLAFSFSGTKKQQYLDALIYAGEIENKETGDSFWKDTAKFYSSVSKNTILEMEKAHSFLRNANQLYLDGKYDQALEENKKASNLFSLSNNKWEANKANYWIGFLQTVKIKYKESTKILEAVRSFCASKDYRWLGAHSQFWIGVNYGSRNMKSKAFRYFKDAAESAESVSDFYNAQKILTETAEEYRLVGRTEVSLKLLRKSLSLAHYPEASVRQQARTHDVLVRVFYSIKNYEAALAYEKEAVKLLDNISDLPFRQSSKRQLGQILLAKKKYREALDVLNESREDALAIKDKAVSADYAARSYISIANLDKELGRFDEAIVNYNKAIGFFDSSQQKADQYLAHKGKLFSFLALKNEKAFESELSTVLDLFENSRQQILVEQNRNAFFDNEQSVYDLAIDFEFGRGNYRKAFDYSEQSRSRSLLDLLHEGAQIEKSASKIDVRLKGVSKPLKVDVVRDQMPNQVEIVEYTVLKDKVLIWHVSNNKFEVVSHKISSGDLRKLTESYMNIISNPERGNSDEREKRAKELYRVLVTPIVDKIDPSKTIAFVPDKFLFQLPFASFISPETDKFLVEEKNFFFAPSANVLLAISEKAQSISEKSSETILSIGNPSFNAKQYPELKPLISAEIEASEIAKHYLKPTVLLREKASKDAIKKNLAKSNVIHFAGHYVVNERKPLFSRFVLSQNGNADDESSSLANYELISEDLTNTHLVVLSACQSGIEGYHNGEGMIGASRSFLAAGIPLVVASQWAVDSNATSDLMRLFHRYRKQKGLSSVNALRKAQIDLINGENEKYRNPFYWSAFAVSGGFSES